jgi:hypothetical protein
MTTDTTENTGPGPGSGNRYGSYVNTNELARTLDETRVLRLALNVLYDGLPRDITRGPVEDTLATIHDHLTERFKQVGPRPRGFCRAATSGVRSPPGKQAGCRSDTIAVLRSRPQPAPLPLVS